MNRTSFCGLAASFVVALLLVASPAAAQFGGIGKSLKKKAEEKTIGKITDRHDDENKKLRELISDKVGYDAKFVGREGDGLDDIVTPWFHGSSLCLSSQW